MQAAAQSQALLPNYNGSYYPNVLQAAQGIGMPFLLQQQYKTQPGVTVKQDSFLVYNDITYAIHNHYLNPNKQYDNGYYVAADSYESYNLPAYFGTYRQQLAASISNLLQSYNVYAVPLFDCSGQNVHFNDSRKYMSGIGHGTLLLLTDKATDTPQGFIFSPPHKSSAKVVGTELMSQHVVAITVGRYIP